MTALQARRGERRSSFEWAVRAAWLLAVVATALQLIGVVAAAADAVASLTSDTVTVSIATAVPLHAVGRNSYSGSPFVADDASITATGVRADVSGVAPATRIGLALGPLAWALTGAGVATSAALAFGRLRRARPSPRTAARAFAIAALITAVGTSAAQVLDEIARTGLQGALWHGSTGVARLGLGGGFTFQIEWLAVAVGTLAIAAVVARTDPAESSA